MKKLILLFMLVVASCSSDDNAKESQCDCTIYGIKYVSFDSGITWDYKEEDNRTGSKMPCSYDGTETNQIYGSDGVWYKTVWSCVD